MQGPLSQSSVAQIAKSTKKTAVPSLSSQRMREAKRTYHMPRLSLHNLRISYICSICIWISPHFKLSKQELIREILYRRYSTTDIYTASLMLKRDFQGNNIGKFPIRCRIMYRTPYFTGVFMVISWDDGNGHWFDGVCYVDNVWSGAVQYK